MSSTRGQKFPALTHRGIPNRESRHSAAAKKYDTYRVTRSLTKREHATEAVAELNASVSALLSEVEELLVILNDCISSKEVYMKMYEEALQHSLAQREMCAILTMKLHQREDSIAHLHRKVYYLEETIEDAQRAVSECQRDERTSAYTCMCCFEHTDNCIRCTGGMSIRFARHVSINGVSPFKAIHVTL